MIEKNAIVKEISNLSEAQAVSVMEFIANIRSRPGGSARNVHDDLIGTLADAYENKRARQVLEWDRVRRARAGGLNS